MSTLTSDEKATIRRFPIQTAWKYGREQARIPESVYMAAYEVYSHVYGPQEAIVDFARGCRGGFGMGELIAFLYARPFPKDQWRMRVDEAFANMEGFS